jgi:flagellar basal-body rod protein FlgG
MAGLAELAAVMMDASQRRIETTANNVSNMSTPGFRTRRVFQSLVDQPRAMPAISIRVPPRQSPVAFKVTGNALDIAVSPPATLLFRAGDRLFAANSAQLRRDGEGRLIDGMGRILQAAGGGDLVVGSGSPVVQRDGVVLIDGQPAGRIGMFSFGDASSADAILQGISAEAVPETVDDAVLQQGTLISSDVDLAAEMVELAQAGRGAETGAKIFQLYDELLGKASSAFGGAGR